MSEDGEFAVFAQEEDGPAWRDFLLEVEAAKAKAQELARREGMEVFVVSFNDGREVGRFFPKPRPQHGGGEAPHAGGQELQREAMLEILSEMALWIHERCGWVMRPAHASGEGEAVAVITPSLAAR